MPLVPAKCPNCGGNINVDSSQAAAICESCKQPFIVEQAINNFNTTYNITNTNNITAEHVTVIENKESADNTVSRIYDFLNEGNFQSADEYMEKLKDLDNSHSAIPALTANMVQKLKSAMSDSLSDWDVYKAKDIAGILLKYEGGNVQARDVVDRFSILREASSARYVITTELDKINRTLSGCTPDEIEEWDALTGEMKQGTFYFSSLIDNYKKLKRYDREEADRQRFEIGRSFSGIYQLLTSGSDYSTEYMYYQLPQGGEEQKTKVLLISRLLSEFLYSRNFNETTFENTDIEEFNRLYQEWKDIRSLSDKVLDRQISVFGRYIYFSNSKGYLYQLSRCITGKMDLVYLISDYCVPKKLCPWCYGKVGMTGKCKTRDCLNSRDGIRIYGLNGALNVKSHIRFKA